MRAKMSKIMGFGTPSDGLTPEEKQIEKLIGNLSVENLYAKLPTNRMKAIVAMHFELGYPHDVIAEIFNVDRSMITHEIKIIKKIFLNKPLEPYNPYKKRKQMALTLDEFIRLLMILKQNHQ